MNVTHECRNLRERIARLEDRVKTLGAVDGTKAVETLQGVIDHIALIRNDVSALFTGQTALKEAGARLRKNLRDADSHVRIVRKSLSDGVDKQISTVKELSLSGDACVREDLTKRLDRLVETVLKIRVRQEAWMDVAKNAKLLTDLALKHSAVEQRVNGLVVHMVSLSGQITEELAELRSRGFWRKVRGLFSRKRS